MFDLSVVVITDNAAPFAAQACEQTACVGICLNVEIVDVMIPTVENAGKYITLQIHVSVAYRCPVDVIEV